MSQTMMELSTELGALQAKVDGLQTQTKQFSEADLSDFAETKIAGFDLKRLAVMAAGGAVAPVAANIINKFVPIGNLAPALAGIILRFVVKNQTVRSFSDGMVIASLSTFIGNLLQGKIGFSEGNRDDDFDFAETRMGGVNFG